MPKGSAIMELKILLLSFAALVSANLAASEKLIVCYYGTWATYRHGLGQFNVDDVNANLCTHVVYAFAGIDESGIMKSLDTWLDLPDGRDNFAKFNALKKKNANLKTILAVGGWNEGSAKYSNMAASPTLRANFISSALKMILQYGFDGLDLDWEYPNQRDSTHGVADIDNFSTLIKEIREEFDKHGLLVSAAVSAVEKSAKLSYDVPTISKYLDWVGIMAYDMYGSWDPVTGHNAPLHKGIGDEASDAKTLNTIDNAVEYWLNAGCPPEKIVLGLPFYGRTFNLADASQHNVRSPSTGAGIAGPFTSEPGNIGYNEICNIIQTQSWTVEFDNLAKVPYTYKDRNWVSFDNAESIAEKVNFGLENNLAGFMIWSIETDDFHGTCGEANVLLKTVNRALGDTGGNSSSTTQSSTSSGSTLSTSTESSTSTSASSTDSSSSTAGSTSTTTTAETPIEPPIDGSSVCQSEGHTSNPEDCSSFIVCIRAADGSLLPHYFECPSNLYWDQTNLHCNYPDLVKCRAS